MNRLLIAPEEDYAYLSGFLKARESLFFSSEVIRKQFQLFDLLELEKMLSANRYPVKEVMKDPKAFENTLWGTYFQELILIRPLLPDSYLSRYIHALHGVLFLQDELHSVEMASKGFSSRLDDFMALSHAGTEMTVAISHYVADRFNFLEQFRHQLNPENQAPFYPGGNFSENSIHQLVQSEFKDVDLDVSSTDWMAFITQERPFKKIDFHFLNRFDIYWWHILRTFTDQFKVKAYGIDYIISYLLHFIREIELIKRIYIYATFKLPTDLLKEKLNHVL